MAVSEPLAIVLTPSWGRGGILDARTERPPEPYRLSATVCEDELDLVADWLCLFRDLADPSDPRRCRLREPDGVARLEALGRPLYESLAARLGPDRVAFEPEPRPCGPEETALTAVRVMAEYGAHPIWLDEAERFGCVETERMGISWHLARSLDRWALAYDESVDPDDPGGPARWTADERSAHDTEGRALAAQLVRELRETGRPEIAVTFQGSGGASEPVSPG